MSSNHPSEKRLLKELQLFVEEPPHGMSVDADQVEKNINMWTVNLQGADNTLYEGEQFKLQFTFNVNYPFDSPEVIFVGENIPVHPHVYSNGHICLSILNSDWSPALTVQAVCVSIISMLSSCKKKEKPKGDSTYLKMVKKNPKETIWWFHDDDV